MKLTQEQSAIIDKVSKSSQSLVVDAVAGSGKTSTMVEAVRETSKATIGDTGITCVAFSKKIATELEERMPEDVECMTTHGLGFRVWREHIPDKCKMNPKKMLQIRDDLRFGRESEGDLRRIVALGMANCFTPATPEEDWQDLILNHGLETKLRDPVQAARDMLYTSEVQAKKGNISFDDMLYMPAMHVDKWPKRRLLMIDEAQDISPIQRRMFDKMKSRIVAVGDKHQAIYGFRGADYTSMDSMKEQWKAEELGLTYSFRCPQAIVKEAQQYVPHIKSAPGAPLGCVDSLAKWRTEVFQFGDAIVCRNTKPLVSACLKLIAAGVGANILGREIGQQLISMVKKAKANSIDELYENLGVMHANQIQELQRRKKLSLLEQVDDRYHAVYSVMETCRSPIEVQRKLEDMFSDKAKSKVTLCTIHKSKGLEWPRVFFLDSHLIPSKYAKTDAQIQQEYNIAYVGITRAMRELIYINSEGAN